MNNIENKFQNIQDDGRINILKNFASLPKN